MHVVLLVFAIRFLYYSNMITPWQTLGVEMLNGLTTGKLACLNININYVCKLSCLIIYLTMSVRC